MSITKLQDKPVAIGSPVEVEYAINEIRMVLGTLDWVTHPYFIAQRFYRKKGNKTFYYPETYAPQGAGDRGYHRLTPDNDYKGMFFFLVGRNRVQWETAVPNFMTYPVSVIFSVNLDLIDKSKADQGLFTQELIRDVRKKLGSTQLLHNFQYQILSETRDLKETYREFTLEDLESYNRAPLQCFRIEMTVSVEEEC